jgi:hypothetical protein
MFDSGRITTPAVFETWATANQRLQQRNGLLAALPPYSLTYDPTVIPQLGKVLVKLGITGAPGFYYPPSDPVTP